MQPMNLGSPIEYLFDMKTLQVHGRVASGYCETGFAKLKGSIVVFVMHHPGIGSRFDYWMDDDPIRQKEEWRMAVSPLG
jgi:hypothetical protein